MIDDRQIGYFDTDNQNKLIKISSIGLKYNPILILPSESICLLFFQFSNIIMLFFRTETLRQFSLKETKKTPLTSGNFLEMNNNYIKLINDDDEQNFGPIIKYPKQAKKKTMKVEIADQLLIQTFFLF